jgi:hypothetical protein
VWRAPIWQADRFQPHALAEAVRARILARLSEERFADCSVQQTFWRVIDEVCYVASLRTCIGLRLGTGCVVIGVATPPVRLR